MAIRTAGEEGQGEGGRVEKDREREGGRRGWREEEEEEMIE